jgi:hypothetical protein
MSTISVRGGIRSYEQGDNLKLHTVFRFPYEERRSSEVLLSDPGLEHDNTTAKLNE